MMAVYELHFISLKILLPAVAVKQNETVYLKIIRLCSGQCFSDMV